MFKIFIIFSVSSFSFGAQYNCHIDFGSCRIWDLNITQADTKIEPIVENRSAVTRLSLTGKVPVLTGGFCEVLPNLKWFQASSVSLEVVNASTLRGCDNLEKIYIEFNNLKYIEQNTFKGLKQINKLKILGGNIPVLDLDLTDLKELKVLVLAVLNITIFPAEILREQKCLEDLYLYSNNLFDLNVEGILKYTPNLKAIHLADNNFKCSRLKEIMTFLKEKNVELSAYHIDYFLKKRDYIPEKIDNIHCLSDEQWNKLNPSNEGRFFEGKDEKTLNLNSTLINIMERLSKLEETYLEMNEKTEKAVNNIKSALSNDKKEGVFIYITNLNKDKCHKK